MKTGKIIRYIGLGMLILSVVFLMYLYSYTLFKDTKAASKDRYAVLEVSSDSGRFPRTDFDVLYAKLEVASQCVIIDASASIEEQKKQITAAMQTMESDHIILIARNDACIPALYSSSSATGAASVILLTPGLSEKDDIEVFGTLLPDIPVAVFDADTSISSLLYERLSGEDTTLFPGFTDNSVLSPTVNISPDGSRYLSRWDLPGQTQTARAVLLYLPQVQIKIGQYISHYVLDSGSNPGANPVSDPASDPASVTALDLRSASAVSQIIRIMSFSFLFAGLFLFFASIPKIRRDAKKPEMSPEMSPDATLQRPEPQRPDSQGSDVLLPGVFALHRKQMFLLSALISVVFSAAMIFLFASDVKTGPAILSCWPVIYYAACAVFNLSMLPKSMLRLSVPMKRLVFSAAISLLLLGGILLLTFMNIYVASAEFSGVHGLLSAVLCILLTVLSLIRISADSNSRSRYNPETDRMAYLKELGQHAVLVFPYLALTVYLAAAGREFQILECAFLLLSLLTAVWIRHIIRRTSGTDFLAAAVFSVCYILTAFI